MSPACNRINGYPDRRVSAAGGARAAAGVIPVRLLSEIDVVGRRDLPEVALVIVVLVSLLIIGG
jgi:hypothetical protein